jgi:hypothetical protein
MSDLEARKAQKEAMEAAAKGSSSTERARLWAGMNRYLASEARHEQKLAEAEREDHEEREERERADDRPE